MDVRYLVTYISSTSRLHSVRQNTLEEAIVWATNHNGEIAEITVDDEDYIVSRRKVTF